MRLTVIFGTFVHDNKNAHIHLDDKKKIDLF